MIVLLLPRGAVRSEHLTVRFCFVPRICLTTQEADALLSYAEACALPSRIVFSNKFGGCDVSMHVKVGFRDSLVDRKKQPAFARLATSFANTLARAVTCVW